WRDLEGAGIDRNAVVSMHLKNISLRQALDHILAEVGSGTVRLGHTIADKAIVISTDEALAKNVKTPAYDRRDLIQGNSESLIKLIEGFVDADTWKDNGGTIGAVQELNGKLVIQQTPEGHEKIADLLKLLRDEHAAAPKAGQVPPGQPGGAVAGMPDG